MSEESAAVLLEIKADNKLFSFSTSNLKGVLLFYQAQSY